MFTAYVDETGQQGKGLVIVSGFVGEDESWKRLSSEWPAGFGNSQRRSLHLKDWKFKSKNERKLLERLGPIPERCGLIRVSGSVNVSDYSDLIEGSVAQVHAHGYSVATVPLILAIRGAIPRGERFEIVFEEQTALGFYRDKVLQHISLVMERDPVVKSGEMPKQLVGWKTLTKGQTRLFEPADYLCYHLAHFASDPNSKRSTWTRPIVGNGRVHIKHLTRDFVRHLFSLAPSLRIPQDQLDAMKLAIRTGTYDPWEEFFSDPENQ